MTGSVSKKQHHPPFVDENSSGMAVIVKIVRHCTIVDILTVSHRVMNTTSCPPLVAS